MNKILLICLGFTSLNCKSFKTNNVTMKFKFNTSYSQIYIVDAKYRSAPKSFSWEEIDFKSKLVNDDLSNITLFTESYGYIKGELSVLEKVNNQYSIDSYDHIVESVIEIKSGNIQILDCPFSSVIIDKKILPGKYGIRVYFSNLDSVVDPDNEASDYYKIELWPDESSSVRKVIKWNSKNAD